MLDVIASAGSELLATTVSAGSGELAVGLGMKTWVYAGFIGLVLLFLALDLGVFHREAHAVKMKEAIAWSIVWVVCALAFNAGLYFMYEAHFLGLGLGVPVLGEPGVTQTVDGWTASKQFLTGYIVEKSLSMDNVFVIAMIFGYFAIPEKYQHRVLFWGILGALVMRGVMIAIGAELVARFSWIIYVFGAFLILTALKMALARTEGMSPGDNAFVRLVRRMVPVSERLDGQRFFTRVNGVRHATPLFLALVMVEVTDVIFAVDSIPAIFAITADPFIVFTSNVFAILGLRALYFCLAAMIGTFRYLKPALIVVLAFVGVKMMLVHTSWKIDTTTSLLVILGVLGCGVVASLVRSKSEDGPAGELRDGAGTVGGGGVSG